MMNTTITSLDKIKRLDQMLEDLAGDEFDEFDDFNAVGSNIETDLKRYAANVQLSNIDNIH